MPGDQNKSWKRVHPSLLPCRFSSARPATRGRRAITARRRRRALAVGAQVGGRLPLDGGRGGCHGRVRDRFVGGAVGGSGGRAPAARAAWRASAAATTTTAAAHRGDRIADGTLDRACAMRKHEGDGAAATHGVTHCVCCKGAVERAAQGALHPRRATRIHEHDAAVGGGADELGQAAVGGRGGGRRGPRRPPRLPPRARRRAAARARA